MTQSSIARTAGRLRWAVWVVWGCVIVIYALGRIGMDLGAIKVASRSELNEHAAPLWTADIVVFLLTIALYQLSRMLGAISAGDHFSSRVIGAFRLFALWLLILALFSIAAPIAASLLSGPGAGERYELKFELHDLLTIGVTLILFLVARLLERARGIEEEMREIV